MLILATLALAKDGPKPGHLCPESAKVVFDCRLEDGGRLSVCASPELSDAVGWVQIFQRDINTVPMWDPNPREGSRAYFQLTRESGYQRRTARLSFTAADQPRTLTITDDDSSFPKVHRATLVTQTPGDPVQQVCARPWYGDLAALENVVPTVIEAR